MTIKMIPLLAWAALPVFAQSPAPQQPAAAPAPAACAPCCCKDSCKDAPPCKADFSKKMLERFDADKDGKLDAQELSAMHAARPCCHKHPGKHGGKGACPGKKDAPAAPAAPATPAAPANAPATPTAPAA